MADKRPSGTPAVATLRSAAVPYQLHSYDHDPSQRHYGDETVARLNLDPGRVFKTLLAQVPGPRRPELVVGVVPVAGKLDLKALASALGVKTADLADPAAAERSSGYVVGGISPLGQRTRLRTVVDATVRAFETVFVSAGKRGLQIELAPVDLINVSGALVAPIARPS